MKHKFSFILSVAFMVFLGLTGVFMLLFMQKESTASETENRMLQGLPSLTVKNLASGQFADEFDNYLSDNALGRDSAISAANGILSAFSTISGDEAFEKKNQEMEQRLEAEGGIQNAVAEVEEEEGDEGEISTGLVLSAGEMPIDSRKSYMWYVKTDGTLSVKYEYLNTNVDTYAQTLLMLKDCLPTDGVINFVEGPLASQANRWRDQQDVYSGWGSSLELMLQQSLGGARNINVYSAWNLLAPYVCGETPMFYFTDHHWSAEAAYIIASAMLEDQGLPVIPYDEYRYKAITSSAIDEEGRRDIFNVLYPLTPVHSYVVKRGVDHEISLMAYDVATYTSFMNGSREPWRKITTGAGTGRKALVVCDSFGNAFTPYLLAYYDEVHMCDFRYGYYDHNEAGGYIKDNIAKYGIDDVYIVISTANDLRKDNSIKYFRQYLGF
ncbi:MAG: hypothetical protein IJM56_10545 [Clostridia bacterium]|nr:hypothetical protein [Clostridia bacterium]